MKKIVLVLSAFILFTKAHAQSFGTFASAVFISQNGTENGFNVTGSGENLIGKIENPFIGDLGSYRMNSANLILKGGEVKTFKDNGTNVCGATMYYSIHLIDSTSGFTSLNLPFKASCVGNVFTDNLGPCGGNDQKWSTEAESIDLTTYPPGNYAIDVYYVVPGSQFSLTACDQDDTIGNSTSLAGTMTFTITQPLAIQLISFTGNSSNNTNLITWLVGSEDGLKQYELEKSFDGSHFQPVVKVAVNPAVKGNYRFTDVQSNDGQSLYRLKMVDKNGSYNYSNIISINDKTNSADVMVMPNPTNDYVNVKSMSGEQAVISLFDITGKMINSFATSSITSKVDLSGLYKGSYIITYKSAHSLKSFKIVKQ